VSKRNIGERLSPKDTEKFYRNLGWGWPLQGSYFDEGITFSNCGRASDRVISADGNSLKRAASTRSIVVSWRFRWTTRQGGKASWPRKRGLARKGAFLFRAGKERLINQGELRIGFLGKEEAPISRDSKKKGGSFIFSGWPHRSPTLPPVETLLRGETEG